MSIPHILSKVGYLTAVISSTAIVIGIFFWNRISALNKALTVFMMLMLGIDLLSYLIGYVISDNNMIVLHIYSFVELSFMIYFYKKHMFRKKQQLLTVLAFGALGYILCEMLLIFVFKGLVIKDFSPLAKVIENFIIILFSLAFISEKINRYREQEWGNFRLNIVFLAFYTLNAFFFLPFNFVINAGTMAKYIFVASNMFFLISYYLYLTIEILRNGLKGAPASSGLRK